jgi:Aspartate/tyrosine/aromatic aminotransferase
MIVMHELAKELNDVLNGTVAGEFLSPVGKRMYFPKGIVAQAAEAGAKAKKYNATVGLAVKDGQPMYLTDIYSQFVPGAFQPKDIFNYAPGGGDKELRALWHEYQIEKNPSLKNKVFSQPLVTGGLTHGMSLVGELFVGEGDEIVLPNLFWDNYDLIFNEKYGASPIYFSFYDESGAFNIEGMKKAMLSAKGDKVRIVLNFPNNPTGYTPTRSEFDSIEKALLEVVAAGKKILVLSDDAYFGLFYEEETEKESLFARICDLDENIFAIKGDAATKEEMVWGFRIGFLTYGFKGATKDQLDALTNKTLGAIRCTVSNCDRPGQSLLLKALKEGKNVKTDKKATFSEMEGRYLEMKRVLSENKSKYLRPYLFNSGYFMSFDTMGRDAEELRTYLLDKYGIGVINIMGKTLRVAYCSVEKKDIENLIKVLFRAADELWN